MIRSAVFVYFRPSFGGGERYLLTAAAALRELGPVDFLCPQATDLAPFEEGFGLDLSGVTSRHHPWRRLHGWRDAARRAVAPRYDWFLALDNHLSPMQLCLGRRGALILQTPPYPPKYESRHRARWKLRTFERIVVYSRFTERHLREEDRAGLPVDVIPPPIDTSLYRPGAKRNVILSVGRFFRGRHEKRHDVLIDAFRDLVRGGLSGWELRLAGSLRAWREEDRAWLGELRRRAEGLPVTFHVDVPLDELRALYAGAKVLWHAAGYGVDAEKHPQHLEHFGMAVAEGMSAGAVPVVPPIGGLPEIVTDGLDGLVWRTVDELKEKTLALAGDETLRETLAQRAVESAARFERGRFEERMRALALGREA